MAEKEKVEGMLSPYRVLDLTDEKGLLCGKLLGDLGADVIKVERPGGDPARSLGPFYHDEVDPEKSLFWFAFNTSKRGITLDIETADGQELFKKLVKTADFVIESFPLGYMEKHGLGYSELEKINPGIIMVSITPFGQTGPYRNYKASDIVAFAMGGMMNVFGDADRAPVRMSHHSQAYLTAGLEAAVGATMALYHREMTGEGQQVDISIQESVARTTSFTYTSTWDMMKINEHRGGTGFHSFRRRIWPCKDGYVLWFFFGGVGGARRSRPLVEWMDSEGMADDYLKGFDWEALDFDNTTQEVVDRISEPAARFFMTHTKAELLDGALKHRVILYPVSTIDEVLESVQLAARKFWVQVEHPELGTTITYPGAFAKTPKVPPRISSRAPLIGEHNQEVYEKELDLSKEELLALRQVKDYLVKPKKKNKSENPEEKMLEGLKVADFTWVSAGSLIAKPLAAYGAEVIKIEGRSRADSLRTGPPFKDGIPGLNRSGHFNQYNTGKRSIALNLANPKGKAIAKKLVAWADIVLENYAGGVMERMGFGYEELKKINPDIIMVRSCMQGQTGPFANHPGYGPQLTALTGLNHITGWPDRPPPWLGAYTDYTAPRFSRIAVLAALIYRHRTGKGQELDVAQYEGTENLMAPLILDYVVNQRIADRMGNRYPYAAPHGAYRCHGEDKWCAIAVFTDEEWESFCGVIGNPSWTKNPKFSTLQARKENEDELERLVEDWTINHSAEEVMSMMQAAGVSAGVVQTAEDLLEHDPHLKYRQLYPEVDHPEIGKYHPPRPAFLLSKYTCEIRRSPLLGEHNEYVLKEVLGMSDEEIAELVVEGVVE